MKKAKVLLRFWLFWCGILGAAAALWSQPYVDPILVRYTRGSGGEEYFDFTPFNDLWVGGDLPIQLKEHTYLLLSPSYERWWVDRSYYNQDDLPDLQSVTFPVGLILPLSQSKWSLTLMPIVRWNGEQLFTDNTFQFGGLALLGYAFKPEQKIRLGVYANDEFFGLFVMPLLGVDWRLNEKNYLFGTLPGRLTYEHQWSEERYGGATFRAPTNSYRLPNGEYVRMDDIQLSLYMDFYPSSHFCIRVELGGSYFEQHQSRAYYTDGFTAMESGAGLFTRLSAAYRIRR